jgi:hypothetical protein
LTLTSWRGPPAEPTLDAQLGFLSFELVKRERHLPADAKRKEEAWQRKSS